MTLATSLTLVKRPDGVGILYFDVAGESVNTLRAEFAEDFTRAFDAVERDPDLVALVIASGKKDSFIAGADISMLARLTSADAGTTLSRVGQIALNRIEDSKLPVVAAIHGACLGGGLELALACSGRVATPHEKTRLGLPEVQLGILPGLGGTQRLPRVVGLTEALPLLLTGKQLDARRAQKIGLVDEVVAESSLIEVAAARALSLAKHGTASSPLSALRELLSSDELKQLALAENPLGRKVVFDKAKKTLLEKTRGNYPAPERILEVVRRGLERGLKAGLMAEAEAFGELVVSFQAKALRHVYFAGQALKRDDGTSDEADVKVNGPAEHVAVIGAGLMGVGIASVTASRAGARVRLVDVNEEGIARGLAGISKDFDVLVKHRKLNAQGKKALLASVTRTTDISLLGAVDVVIEAVFEDISLKRRIVSEVEKASLGETIFASNTSSLPISEIAREAKHPERIIGMHYFSPVQKMPLLEVITTEKTSPWVVRTCVELGKRQGKTVIVVSDGPGFFTTRILGPYLNEAAFALMEGFSVESIDAEVVQAGFPIGPLALLDEVGIDVGTKVAKTLMGAFGSRLAPPQRLSSLTEAGRLGRKNGRGFYDYSQKTSGPKPVDLSVYGELGLAVPKGKNERARGLAEAGGIAERCLLSMVNEAIHCLGEGVLKSARDGDIGAIYGLGFPPFLGGPFFYVDQQGSSEVLRRLTTLEQKYGARFTPAPLLREMAQTNQTFYPSR